MADLRFTFSPELADFSTPSLNPSSIIAANTGLAALAVGAFVFNPSYDKILLIRRSPHEFSFSGLWEVPGGGLEIDQDPTIFHAVSRELREETGLTLKHVVTGLKYVEFSGSRGGQMWRKYNFVVEVEEGVDDVKTDPKEHDKWGWFSREEVKTVDVTTKTQRRSIEEAFERVGK